MLYPHSRVREAAKQTKQQLQNSIYPSFKPQPLSLLFVEVIGWWFGLEDFWITTMSRNIFRSYLIFYDQMFD